MACGCSNSTVAAPVASGVESGVLIDLQVTGMHCGGCLRRVERALLAVPGVTGAKLDLATGQAHVHVAVGGTGAKALVAAVAAAGYGATA